MAKLATAVNTATVTQTKDMAAAAQLSEQVQLFTRQTSRALSEQTQVVESLAEESSRQASSLKTIAASARQQASASSQIASSTEEMRNRLSEVVRGSTERGANGSGVEELRAVAGQLLKLRQLQEEQARSMASLLGAVDGASPAGAG